MNVTTVLIAPEAKNDMRAARDYYADKGIIARHPEATAIAFGRTRLNPMRQFPYVIGYVFLDGIVHVTGVQHGALGWDEFQRRQV